MYTSLTISGWIFTLIFTAAIFVPWIMSKRHLASAFNLFMLGSINFLGLGMIQNAKGIGFGEFDSEVTTFILAMFVFYGCMLGVYFWPRRKVQGPLKFNKWPQDSQKCMRTVAVVLSIVGFVASFIPYFPGVQILYVINGPLTIFCFGIAFIAFLREPKTMSNWWILGFTLGIAVFTVLTWGTGRRELLSVLLTVPVVGYWVYFRSYPKFRTMLILTILGSFGMITITAYSTMRHSGREAESTISRVLERVTLLPSKIVETTLDFKLFGEQGALLDGQNAVWSALTTIALTESEILETDPLAMTVFVVVNPVPRAVWPDKPRGLGKILPERMGEPVVTWGPSVIGHAFYDGGWPVVFLYGSVFGLFFRWFDLRMFADPTNPWRLALLCSVLAHIIGLPRGDCGTFLVNIFGPMVIVPLVLRIFSIWFGRRPA